MIGRVTVWLCLCLAGWPATLAAQSARDYVSVVGSSTVYPFVTIAAERFGWRTGHRTPKVEATGTGGGFKSFCGGLGLQYPDLTAASRRIKPSELDQCRRNGVSEVIEIKLGFDGIVLAHAGRTAPMALTRRQIWLALAKRVPAQRGGYRLVENPNRLWSDVDPSLPALPIAVLGPPPTSGTRDAFAELTLQEGCRQVDWIAELAETDPIRFRAICQGVREDGAYIEVGENDNQVIQRLLVNPDAIGIIGFSFLDQSAGRLSGVRIDGSAPSFATIAAGGYPLSRSLYVYAKKAHLNVVPGLAAFVGELASAGAVAGDGYLAARGLVPLSDAERAAVSRTVAERVALGAITGGRR